MLSTQYAGAVVSSVRGGENGEDWLPVTTSVVFSNFTGPMAFNANGAGTPWTPTALRDIGVTDLSRVTRIVIEVRGTNIREVINLCVRWADERIPIKLVFPSSLMRPSVSDAGEAGFMGLDAEECYEPDNGVYAATMAFRDAVAELFDEDSTVVVERAAIPKHFLN
jgi:hypothetical protein